MSKMNFYLFAVKFMFSKKATKIDETFIIDLTNCQIDGEDFVKFCGLLRKHELYLALFQSIKYINSLSFH